MQNQNQDNHVAIDRQWLNDEKLLKKIIDVQIQYYHQEMDLNKIKNIQENSLSHSKLTACTWLEKTKRKKKQSDI
jgi:hypothetical protein